MEWLAGLCGLVMLAGLSRPWSEGETALASIGFLDVLLLLVAAAAVVLPVIAAFSSRSDVPIVYETTLWTASLPLILILLIKIILPPDGGHESGFWLTLAGLFALGLALFRSVAREN